MSHAASLRTGLVLVLVSSALLIASATTAEAATKSACSGEVGEQVTYSGGTVTGWWASVYPGSGYNCRTAYFFKNGGLVAGKQVCGTGTLVAHVPGLPKYMGSGSQLCASFAGEPGYPCVTI